MILIRKKMNTSRGPVYRIDIVDTVGELGYISYTPPAVRIVERNRCPQCDNQDDWIYTAELSQGECQCGHSWQC